MLLLVSWSMHTSILIIQYSVFCSYRFYDLCCSWGCFCFTWHFCCSGLSCFSGEWLFLSVEQVLINSLFKLRTWVHLGSLSFSTTFLVWVLHIYDLLFVSVVFFPAEALIMFFFIYLLKLLSIQAEGLQDFTEVPLPLKCLLPAPEVPLPP